MTLRYKNLRQKTRLLLDEALSTVRSSLRDDPTEAMHLPQLVQLEQRILMSASPAAVVAEPVDVVDVQEGDAPAAEDFAVADPHSHDDVQQDEESGPHDTAAQQSVEAPHSVESQHSVELVVIDPSADDYEQLVADLTAQTDRNFEVLVLDPRRDGISQITDALGELSKVSAIHLVSHGEAGEILLGTSVLSHKNIARHAAELVTWQHAMTADADLLVYGCDLAASDEGIRLTESLNMLLGADVAASDDDTGHMMFGGDWILEYSTGAIETDIAFSTDVQQNWMGLLNVTIDGAASTTTAAMAASSTSVSHTTSGSNRLMLVGISFGEDKGDTVSTVTYGGQSLTLVGAHDHSSDSVKSRVEIWGLVAPNTGTNSVVVNFSGTNHEGATIGVMTFNNADQVQPWGTFAGNDGSSSNPSVNVESAPTELVFGVAAMTESSNQNFTPGAGQTQHWDLFREKANGAGTTEAGAASVTTTWSTSPGGDLWVAAGVSVNKLSAVVDTTADYGAADANYGDTSSIENLILDKGDDNLISLREALEAAKNTAGVDTVNFNLTGSGPHTISLISALPDIDHEVIINGWSEPAYAGTPVIELDGSSVGDDGLRFVAGSDGSIVRGLVINGFGDDAIEINNTSDITVHGNYLGTNAAGTASVTNAGGGINIVNADSNTIGGTTAAERNVISGNLFGLVNISGAGSTTNVVQGNYLGLNAAGTATLTGNGFNGVWIASGASNNTIGGTTAGAGNVIAGMDEEAIEVDGSSSTGNIIQGNYIGVDAAGTTVLSNAGHGIALENAVGTLIGGTSANAGNLIGGSSVEGILIAGSNATNNTIQGNFIGTDSTGTLNLANNGAGIRFRNTFESVSGGADGNLIGGTTAGAGNIIAYNVGDGVRVQSAVSTDNAILGNVLRDNGGLGIDLGSGGSDTNDTGVQDADTGANDLQNYPTITSAVASADGSSVDITFSLDSLAGQEFRIEFFENQNTETNGEAVQFLGSTSVTTDGGGLVTNQLVTISGYGSDLMNLDFITATATVDDAGTYKSTSEFGSNHIVQFRPEISVGGTRSFVEDGGPVFLDTSITIADLDSPNFNGGSLTVDIDDANGTANDRLIINDEGSGSGQIHLTDTNKLHYDGNASHFATFSGGTSDTDPLVISFVNTLATQAAVDRLAENIQFDNVSNTPSTAQRNVTFVLNDGANDSVVDSVNVNVAKTNDPPTGSVTVTGTATEDQTLSVSDTLNDLDGMGTVTYQWQRNGGNITGETGSTYTLDDADAGQNIRVQASYTDGESNFHQVNSNTVGPIVNVNDAPVLDNSQNLTFADVVNAPGGNDTDGDSVLDLLLSDGGPNPITDGDPSDTLGIAINQIDDSNGTWEYSTDGATWNAIDPDGSGPTTIANNNALLLEADGGGLNRIRFTPNTGYTGTVTGFKFRAWDGTESPGVGNGSYANIDTLGMGADKAFSTVEDTASVTAIATYFLDQFESVSYGINDGTHDFAGGWIDSQDGSASAGDIRIFNSGELRVRASTGEINLSRQLDLSAAVSATLTYDLSVNGFTSGHLKIQARTGGAGLWTDVDTIDSTTALGSSAAIDLTPFIAADTEIRIYVPTAGTEVGVNPRFEEIRIDYVASGLPTGDLWFTTKGPGDATGLTWADTEVVRFGDGADTFDLDAGTTSGTFDKLPNFVAPADIRALHYVETNLRIGTSPNHFDLQPGDLVMTLDPGGSPATVTLNSGEANPFAAERQDIVVFRPTSLNDYTEVSGEWFMLLDSKVEDSTKVLNVHGLALVETDTDIGGTTLTAGTFIVAHANPDHQDIATLTITGTGANSAANLIDNFLAGATLGNSGDQIQGIHLLQQDTKFGTTTLTEGTLLVQVNASGTYAGVTHEPFDVIALDVTQTEQGAGTAATGQLLFDGSDIALADAGNESLHGFTIVSSSFATGNTTPTITSNGGGATAAINVAENSTAVTTVVGTDVDMPAQTLTYSLSGGADQALFNIDSSSGVLTFVAAPDFESPTDAGSNNVYDVQVQVSDGVGGFDTQDIAVTVTNVDLLAYESFSYGAGSLQGANGGTGWASAWNTTTGSSAIVNATGLTDPSGLLPIQGGTAEMNTSLQFEQSRDLTTTLGTDGTTAWFSFLLKPDGVFSGGMSLILGDSAGANDTVTVGTNNNDFLITKNESPFGASYINNVLVDAQTYFLTVQVDFAAGADTVTLYVDSTPGLSSPDSPGALTAQLTTADLGMFTQVGLVGGFSGNNSNIDEIRVGETFLGVAPSGSNTAPTVTSNGGGSAAAMTVAENTTAVTTVTATDPEAPPQVLTYSLSGGADQAKFNIDSSSGVLTFVSAPDFESPTDTGGNNVYDVQVQVSDGLGGIDTQNIAVMVTDANDSAPLVTASQSFSVSEAAANGTSLGTVAATDGDAGTTFSSWTITGGNADGIFEINAATGEITVDDNSNLDFETNNSYTLSLTVSDGTNISAVENVAITINDVNDNTPIITGGQSFSVSEAAADGASLGTVAASDADAGATLSSWTITGGNTDGIFAINSATGEITVGDNTNLDFDTTNSYTLSLTVSDGINTSAVQTVDVDVTAVNDNAPVFTSSSSLVVPENTPNLVTLTATDADLPGQSISFSIVGGDDAGLMHITGSGILMMTPAADFETPVDANGDNVYEVQVQADDGNGRTTIQSITVTITDVNDNTPVITGGQSFNVSESAADGTSLGTVAASDADAGTTFSGWTITDGNTDGVFAINSSTGEITVVDNSSLDFEATTSYTLNLTVSDGTNTSSSQTVAISVTDVNDSTPVITGGQTFSVSEAAADGASLGTAIATDGDAATTFSSWTITGGNADGIFAIDSSTGEITVADNSNLDFETTTSYTLSLTVSDGTNTSSTETVFIEVTNQNETPVAQDDSYSVTEGNSFNASALLGVITNDSDVDGNPLAVSLISSPAFASAFTLNADGSFSYTHNGSETTNDSFTYQLSDGFGGIATATVTLTVSPDGDAPTVSAIADASTPEDTPLGPINFTVGDNDTPVSSLIVTASSNDQNIIADANIAVTGTGANRSVSLSPVANAAGTATITVSVSDGTSITTTSFDVTVTPVNDAPTITSIPDIITNEDSLTASANFTVSDIDTSGSAITVTAVSSNQSLISDSNIVVRSSGGTRQVQFAPQENAFGGPATITLTVSDGIASASTTFDVTVLPVNDAPVYSSPVNHRYDLPSDESVIVSAPGLLAGVTDVEGDALTVGLDTMPRQGTLTVQADGSFTYEANAEFTGSDSFRFYVTDGSGNSTPRTVIVQAPVTVPAPSTDTGTTPQDGSSQSTTDDETNSGDDTNASDESETPDATTPSATAPDFNDDDDNDEVPPVVVGEDDETDAFAAFQATLAAETQYEFVFDLTVAVASEGSDRVENSTLKSLEQQARELWVLNGGDPKGLLTSVDTQLFGYERFAELRGTVHHVTGFEDNLDSEYTFNDITTSTVAVAGTSIVIGSVLTAIRTGMLALGLLSQLPVWTWFDPLLVMDGVGGGEEGDSLQDIVDRQDAGEDKKNE